MYGRKKKRRKGKKKIERKRAVGLVSGHMFGLSIKLKIILFFCLLVVLQVDMPQLLDASRAAWLYPFRVC